MLKRLEDEQGLIASEQDEDDKRKRWFDLTERGAAQEEVGNAVSNELSRIFYGGFDDEKIEKLDNMLVRVLSNLESAMAVRSLESGK